MSDSTVSVLGVAVGAAGLVVALVTLGILVAQERRAKRHRPRPDWAFRRVGPATLSQGGASEVWETFEVTNSGTASATITEARIFGARQRFQDGYVIPRVLPASASARVLVGEGFEDAWMRITYHHPWWHGVTVLWRPLDVSSALADELTEQILARRRSRWMRWKRRSAPTYVGPGGLPVARIPPNNRKLQRRIESALAHPMSSAGTSA